MANRDVLVQKIRQVKADLKTAGVILRCDLQKHIHYNNGDSEDSGPNLTGMNNKWKYWGWSKYINH